MIKITKKHNKIINNIINVIKCVILKLTCNLMLINHIISPIKVFLNRNKLFNCMYNFNDMTDKNLSLLVKDVLFLSNNVTLN